MVVSELITKLTEYKETFGDHRVNIDTTFENSAVSFSPLFVSRSITKDGEEVITINTSAREDLVVHDNPCYYFPED